MPLRNSVLILIVIAIFGVWCGAALIYGKFWNPRGGLRWIGGEMIDRRKEPVSYWSFVVLTGGVAVFFLVPLTLWALSK